MSKYFQTVEKFLIIFLTFINISCEKPETKKVEFFFKNSSGCEIEIDYISLMNTSIGYTDNCKNLVVQDQELRSMTIVELSEYESINDVIKKLTLKFKKNTAIIDVSKRLHWYKTLSNPRKVEYTFTIDSIFIDSLENEMIEKYGTKKAEFILTNTSKESLELNFSSLKRKCLSYEDVNSSLRLLSNQSMIITNVELFDFLAFDHVITKMDLSYGSSNTKFDVLNKLHWKKTLSTLSKEQYSFSIDSIFVDSLKQIKRTQFVNYIQSLDGFTALWDFKEPAGSERLAIGKSRYPLVESSGLIQRADDGPLSGYSLKLDGKKYLSLPNTETGELNIHGTNRGITVVALVKWCNDMTGFVAGMWNEADQGGKRQYGLFVSLPGYNGKDQVCGHISFTGSATNPFPYSIDYSASKQIVPKDKWVCVGFTYNGTYIKSFYNGEFQQRDPELINYTKGFEGYPNGLITSKNPYHFPHGIGNNGSDFTVGAVKIKGGMGNFFKGNIGGLVIFNRALNEIEMQTIFELSLK